MGPLTLLTDFGLSDPWVAEVKAAIAAQWNRWPAVRSRPQVLDLTHDIPAGDVKAARWFLKRVWDRFPRGTVHLAVVDPGVGSDRPAVAASCDGRFFVGPGNGLAGFLLAGPVVPEVVFLDNPLYHAPHAISRTFHGRDIFAPVAAHLALGVPLKQVGTRVDPALLGKGNSEEAAAAVCRIRWIDRFGNAITDLERESDAGRALSGGGRVRIGRQTVSGPLQHYSQGRSGQAFWYWGSGGTLEIACRDARAADLLGLHPGLALEPDAS